MKKSIFKGHVINNIESKKIYESFDSFKSFSVENRFNNKTKILSDLGVNDWEQLYSLLKIDSIKPKLMETLKIDSNSELNKLEELCKDAISDNTINQLNEIDFSNCPLGARKPLEAKTITDKYEPFILLEYNQLIKSAQKINELALYESDKEFSLANSINHISQLSTIKSQGDRGTCTSFAVSVANEFSFFKKTGKYYDFSEQFLFYESKILENDNECGSWIRSAMTVVSNKGICQEGIWSYNPNLPCVQQYGKPSNADNDSSYFRNSSVTINQNDVVALKEVLSSGRIIPFSIPVFDSWYKSSETYRTGRIIMPLPGENPSGGHSMTLVGYQDDINSPGGGYFLIRNSWGKDFARDSYYGAGYGIIPYDYIKKFNWEAFCF